MSCAVARIKQYDQVKNCAIAWIYANQVLTNGNRHRIIRTVPEKEHMER